MKFNSFRLIFLFSISALICSCTNDDTTTELSANPGFSSLTFAANDSIPNIEDAVFTCEYDPLVGDSVIANLDSLPYQTRIDSVCPTFTFNSSSEASIYYLNGESDVITGTDTIDFTQVDRIVNIATNGTTPRTYKIKVNVHQVEPELYIWNKVSGDIDSHDATNQKAIVFNDTIFYYLSNETNAYLYKSTDGKSWSELALTNFPVNKSLSDMQLFNGQFVLTAGNQLYTSTNRRDWVMKTNADYNFTSLISNIDDKLWAVFQSKTDLSKYRFTNSIDGVDWIVRGEVPEIFPVRDFTSLLFSGRTGKPKILLLGGYLANNNYSTHSFSTEDGDYWPDFGSDISDGYQSLDSLAPGASIISYDDKLLLFGLKNVKTALYYKVSRDEGLTWKNPDTTYNRLPKEFEPRSFQSVVVLKPRTYNKLDSKAEIEESNHIFILGGKSGSTVHSDVWTGKLNRKNFLRQ